MYTYLVKQFGILKVTNVSAKRVYHVTEYNIWKSCCGVTPVVGIGKYRVIGTLFSSDGCHRTVRPFPYSFTEYFHGRSALWRQLLYNMLAVLKGDTDCFRGGRSVAGRNCC